ncbi:type I-E CRISPR-associated protein Cas7/Cse4/CasC [Escherichia coli]
MFYTYICIDKDLLVENLGGDEALANQTIRAFTEAALKVSPTGKQNTLPPCLRLLGAGRKRHRSTAFSGGSFIEPINGTVTLKVAVQRLTTLGENIEYGLRTEDRLRKF